MKQIILSGAITLMIASCSSNNSGEKNVINNSDTVNTSGAGNGLKADSTLPLENGSTSEISKSGSSPAGSTGLSDTGTKNITYDSSSKTTKEKNKKAESKVNENLKRKDSVRN
jgi:hypothetical protein